MAEGSIFLCFRFVSHRPSGIVKVSSMSGGTEGSARGVQPLSGSTLASPPVPPDDITGSWRDLSVCKRFLVGNREYLAKRQLA